MNLLRPAAPPAPARPVPKRAICFDANELTILERALADLAIETWGGIQSNPAYATARAKVREAEEHCLRLRT